MRQRVTPIIKKQGKWYVAFVREIPGVNTQGRTLSEARHNLKEALEMVIEANHKVAAKRMRK